MRTKPLDLPKEVLQREDGRWCKPCPSCGEMQDYLRRNYAIQSFLEEKTCKKCSNRKTSNCHRGYFGPIRASWYKKFENSANLRSLEWDLTPEYLIELYDKQNKKCALSGIPIDWEGVGQSFSASIDRIDSKRGYTKENVQLVFKDINMMKQHYDNDYFIEMCLAVADEYYTRQKLDGN